MDNESLTVATKMRKTPTLQDVAGRLGMHKSTVSLALSGKGTLSAETRQHILSVAREVGYSPNPYAQRLAFGAGSSLVCIFSGVLDVGLATEKILLIQKLLTGQSLEVPIYTCYDPIGDSKEAQAVQVRQLCRQRPKAVICAVQKVHPVVFEELAAYQEQGGLVVCYDTPVPLNCDQVIFDREDNAYRAARYLLENGHRAIGIGLSTPSSTNANDPQSLRLRGFQRALAEFDVPYRPEWLFLNSTYEKGGAEMAKAFLSLKERPTAVAIVNDYVSLAFMVEVRRAGVRIPEDLSIIGHDNQPIAAYCPVPLTSMTQPAEQIAQGVVELMMERLENRAEGKDDPTPQRRVIAGELVLRESVVARS